MIQRVQSIYLFLVVVLMSFMLIWPFAEIALKDGQVVVFYSYAVKKYITKENTEILIRSIPVLIMVLLIGLLSFMNIFQFNRRIIQMRVCVLNSLLMIGLLLLMLYYYLVIKRALPVETHALKLPFIIPVVSIILTLLAYRGIHQDEMLVRSYDRLR
jgi:hypothetical protein